MQFGFMPVEAIPYFRKHIFISSYIYISIFPYIQETFLAKIKNLWLEFVDSEKVLDSATPPNALVGYKEA